MRLSSVFNKKAQKAFSLIEVLLTLLILAFIVAFSTQFVTRKNPKVKSIFSDFMRLNNRLMNLSQLRSSNYRLVFKLSLKERDQYWVEKKISLKKSQEEENEEELVASEFERDENFYQEPQILPPLLDIVKIETKGVSKEEGEVFIYYRASLLAQETKIYFRRPDNQGEWILYLDPASKKMNVLK
ncbi:MAG: prepilin-type N-terminal cleavage/methylation domain-containing protein [Bdellovibrionales bacterium]|nr:prepilin-type N-terminal cleavage/methylation domain-containing protein [Bdellovibrionales bacterium]